MIDRYVSLSDVERKTLGTLIKQKRISLDWSAERLAIEIKRSRRTIHIIESGSRPVCPRTIAQIERIWPDLNKTATGI